MEKLIASPFCLLYIPNKRSYYAIKPELMKLSWERINDGWEAGFTLHSSFKELPDGFFLYQIASDNLFKPFDQHYIVERTLTEFIERHNPAGIMIRVMLRKDKDYSELATYLNILKNLSKKFNLIFSSHHQTSAKYLILSQEPPALLNLINHCDSML